jgi:hypothetical protein
VSILFSTEVGREKEAQGGWQTTFATNLARVGKTASTPWNAAGMAKMINPVADS